MHLTRGPKMSRMRARPTAGSPKEGTGPVSLLILSPTHSNPKKTLTPRRNHAARATFENVSGQPPFQIGMRTLLFKSGCSPCCVGTRRELTAEALTGSPVLA